MKRTLRILELAVLLAAIALLVHSWRAARDDRARLAATLAAQQKVIADAAAAEAQRDASLAKSLADIAALKRRVQTPAEAAAAIPAALPPLPFPIRIDLPLTGNPAASSNPSGSTLATRHPPLAAGAGNSPQSDVIPSKTLSAVEGSAARDLQSPSSSTSSASSSSPPALATIPAQDLKPLYDYLENCRASALQLTAVQSDLADERSKSAALATERDAAVRAARGGSFWLRVKRGAKWFAIGAAAGAVATCASGHCK